MESMADSAEMLINNYLKLIKLEPNEFWNSKDAPVVTIRFVFLAALHDYFNKKLENWELLGIGENINLDILKFDRDLDTLLNQLSVMANQYEWDIYQKKLTEKELNQMEILSPQFKEYYQKYKYLIDPYIK